MAGGKHVELLQTGDGLCLDQGVGVVLHDGTAHQTVHLAVAIALLLPCNSGPSDVMRADRHFPRHWWTSTVEGGTDSNSCRTRDRVGST